MSNLRIKKYSIISLLKLQVFPSLKKSLFKNNQRISSQSACQRHTGIERNKKYLRHVVKNSHLSLKPSEKNLVQQHIQLQD